MQRLAGGVSTAMEMKDVRRRMWIFDEASCNVDECFYMDDQTTSPTGVFCVVFPREVFDANGISFDAQVSENKESEYWQMLWQILWKTIEQMRHPHAKRVESKSVPGTRDYASVFMECVEADKKSPEYRKPFVIDRGGVHCSFMEDDVAIIEYRVWVFLYTSVEIPGEVISAIIESNGGADESAPCAKKRKVRKPKHEVRSLPHNKWMGVAWHDQWVRQMCGMYRGEVITNHNAHSLSLSNAMNPANPMNVFSVKDMFARAQGNDKMHRAFGDHTKYFKVLPNTHVAFSFPRPKNVLRIQLGDANSVVMHNKVFPDYQRQRLVAEIARCTHPQLVSRTVAVPPAQLPKPSRGGDIWDALSLVAGISGSATNMFSSTPFNVAALETARSTMDVVESALEAELTTPVSDFTVLRENVMRKQIQVKKDFVDPVTRGRELDSIAAWGVKEFEERCFVRGARFMTETCDKMVAFMGNEEMRCMRCCITPVDPSASVFLSEIARRMEMYDQYMLVSSCHKQLLLFTEAMNNAYQVAFKLNFNAILAGPAAISKSFVFELMEKFSIPGTIQTLSMASPKADMVNGNNSDAIIIMHEYSLQKLAQSDGQEETLMKERQTSGRARSKVLYVDENGERHARTTYNECISTYFVATNDKLSLLTDALRSRNHVIVMEKASREGRSIPDLRDAAGRIRDADKEVLRLFVLERQRSQLMHFIVEKLIYCCILEDVTLSATPRMLADVNKYLSTCPGVRPLSDRCGERICMLARRFAISAAITRVFHMKDSPHFEKRLEISQFRDLDPYLRDTEEIAIFSIGLLKDSEHSVISIKVNRALRTLFEDGNRHSGGLRQVGYEPPRKPLGEVTSRRNSGGARQDAEPEREQEPVDDENYPPQRNSLYADIAAEKLSRMPVWNHPHKPSHVSSSSSSWSPSGRGAERGIPIFDYNYVSINIDYQKLPGAVLAAIDSQDKPSLEQIQDELASMSTCYVTDYPRKSLNVEDLCAFQETAARISGIPQSYAYPERNAGAAKQRYLCMDKESKGRVYVHLSVFKNTDSGKDYVRSAIESTFHARSLPRKVIYGVTHSPAYPHLFQCIQVTRTSRISTNINALYTNGVSSRLIFGRGSEAVPLTRANQYVATNEDTDTLVTRERLAVLGMPFGDDAVVAMYNPVFLDTKSKMAHRITTTEAVNYPDSCIEAHRKTMEKYAKFSDMVDINDIESFAPEALATNQIEMPSFAAQRLQRADGATTETCMSWIETGIMPSCVYTERRKRHGVVANR
jgi:hypothetical protein